MEIKDLAIKIDKLSEKFDKNFKKVDEKFEKIDENFKKVDANFKKIDENFEKVNESFKKVDKNFEQVDASFKNIDQRFKKVEQKLNEVNQKCDDSKTELLGEIRESFFCFEQDYGKEIDAVYDIVVLNKQTTDIKISKLDEKIERNDSRIMRDYMEIESLKKINSKTNSEN